MRKMIKKLKSKKGETFVEILLAVLIVAFGCMLIATMYSSAMNMNISAASRDDQYYSELSATEQLFSSTEATGTGNLIITDDENKETLQTGVKIYGDDDAAAYKRS